MFSNGTNVTINEKGIIWAYEKDQYNRCENSENIQWIDPTNGIFYFNKIFKNLIKRTFYRLDADFYP